mmetsp:Transcript_20026/g.60371  ORF Transcript_20026/g.60371 Transcript_20026/m.60371 type:complete len:236 (+) Transcript_20026:1-708(+)
MEPVLNCGDVLQKDDPWKPTWCVAAEPELCAEQGSVAGTDSLQDMPGNPDASCESADDQSCANSAQGKGEGRWEEVVEYEIDDLSDYLDDDLARSSSLCSRHELDWAAVDGGDLEPEDAEPIDPAPEPGSPGQGLSAADLAALVPCTPPSGYAVTRLLGPPELFTPSRACFEIDDLSDYEDDENARASSLCEVDHSDWAAHVVCAAEWRGTDILDATGEEAISQAFCTPVPVNAA